jgi:hypothetical protein
MQAAPGRARGWCARRSPPSMRATSATRASPATGCTSLRTWPCPAAALLTPRSGGRRRPPPGPGGSPPAPGVAAELLHQPAHRVGHGAADAGVDLVEDQRRRAPSPAAARWSRRWPAPCATARRPRPPWPAARGVLPAWPATAVPPLSSPKDCGSSCGSSATSKRPPAMPSCCIACVTAAASFGAACGARGAGRGPRPPGLCAVGRRAPALRGRWRRRAARQLGAPLRQQRRAARPAGGGSGAPARSRRQALVQLGQAARGRVRRGPGRRAACAASCGCACAPCSTSTTAASAASKPTSASASMARPASASAAGSPSATASSARARRRSAPARGPGAGARRQLVPFAASPGASLSSSPICQARRSRSRSSVSCAPRASPARERGAPGLPQARPAARRRCRPGVEQARAPLAGRVRLCQACWPWMSTRCSAASRSCATVAALPLIQARLLPCASMVRRSSRLSAALEAGLVQPGGRAGRGVELGADLGARRAFAHHAGVAAVAQRQLQRVDQDGLARAGLAGQHGEAGARRARAGDDDSRA